jgi:D-sedoheptulose 7-phosphate isomerase
MTRPPAPSAAVPAGLLRREAAELRRLVGAIEEAAAELEELARWAAGLIVGGARVLTCGNGGSAAEAQHLATELLGRYSRDRRPLPAVALNADGALLTCIGNDYGPDDLFARQVIGLGRPGDLLVALTTLLGKGGGPLAGRAEREWIVPSDSTARVQEAHLFLIHVICDYVDAAVLAE